MHLSIIFCFSSNFQLFALKLVTLLTLAHHHSNHLSPNPHLSTNHLRFLIAYSLSALLKSITQNHDYDLFPPPFLVVLLWFILHHILIHHCLGLI